MNVTAGTAAADLLLQVEDLRTYIYTRDGIVKAVDGMSFTVDFSETLSIVGESGCGKSMTALSVLRLIPKANARITTGHIRLDGRDLVQFTEQEMRRVRGNAISMIFQEPMTSLTPVLSIGTQIGETLRAHRSVEWNEAMKRAREMLRLVHIPDPERRLREFPHQLSGGMRQRVMIAMALACEPKLLIADEPTTALDVTVQAQVLDLMRNLQQELGAAILLITHDLGVVAEMADRVLVMYAGRKVEEAPAVELFEHPLHPYTQGLMVARPRLSDRVATEGYRLREIPGTVPSLHGEIPGCAFADRCAFTMDRCRTRQPKFVEHKRGHGVACWEVDRVGKTKHEEGL
jgi:oligopeptide/dipeptide ABC transporter ATP-binding protein